MFNMGVFTTHSIQYNILKGYSTFFLEIGSFYNSPRVKTVFVVESYFF